MIKFKKVRDSSDDYLKGLLKARTHFDAWAARTLPKLYANAQRQQFMTQGASEGKPWRAPQSNQYRVWKRWSFSTWAGQGHKTMIASARLLVSLLPENERQGLFMGQLGIRLESPLWRGITQNWGKEFRSTVGDGKAQYMTSIPYFRYVNERNNVTTLSQRTQKEFSKSFQTYLHRVAARSLV